MSLHISVARDQSIVQHPENSHNRIWPDLEPIATIDPGEEIELELRDGMDGQLTASSDSAALKTIDLDANHPLTGPIEINGARPGDLLVVTPRRIEPDGFGATAVIPGFGLLGDLFTEHFLVRWRIEDGMARSEEMPGIAIRGRPFLGCVAVAPSKELFAAAARREQALADRGGPVLPPESRSAVPAQEPYASQALRTIPPRENGGNLDVAQASEGSRLLFPVHVPGALLSVGDAHFAQGEGEVCGTAIEVAATVTLEVSVRKADTLRWRPRFPAIEYTQTASNTKRACFETMGIPLTDEGENASLDATLAARRALLELIGWLEAERGLTREQGYVLASVAADLRVAEVVDVPNAVVTCSLPLDVFEDA
ncbi:MAG TPA: acetamidase/formamidase family protein [Solirubrobacteraceae bacterium]|nr:acetamidase/formamidase family protein [Solirubrobacteraceae bacterium]